MPTSSKTKRLLDAYQFAGFRPQAKVRGIFGDPKARVITLSRRSKKLHAARVVAYMRDGTTAPHDGCAICPVATRASTWRSKSDVCIAEAVGA